MGSGKWTIADRYFYQAGPLPEDRYPSLDEANSRANKMVNGAIEAIKESKCPCKKHRTYRAIRAPRTACEECWRFYVRKNP